MKNRFYIIFLILLATSLFSQQQTVYSSFLSHPYLYNPAYAGVVKGTQFNIGHRNQWVGFDGAPRTSIFSGWGNFKKKPHMAAGGMIVTDRTGLIQRTNWQGSYAYNLKVNKKYNLNFGLAFGGVQYNVKLYDAQPYDQDDYFLSNEILRAFAFDANAGLHLYSKEFFLGLSSQQMLNSKIRWSNTNGRLTPHYYIYSGYNFRLSKDSAWVLQPSLLLRTSGPAPHQFEYHLRVIYKELLWAGGSYRERSSASVLFGCNLVKRALGLTYAYDFTTTELSNYSSGSHEITISYLLPYKRKKSAAELQQDADETELNTIDNSIKTNLRNKKKAEKEKDKEEERKKEKEKKQEPPAPETEKPKEEEPK